MNIMYLSMTEVSDTLQRDGMQSILEGEKS